MGIEMERKETKRNEEMEKKGKDTKVSHTRTYLAHFLLLFTPKKIVDAAVDTHIEIYGFLMTEKIVPYISRCEEWKTESE